MRRRDDMGALRRCPAVWVFAAVLSQLMLVRPLFAQTTDSSTDSSGNSGFTAAPFNSAVSWIDSAFPQTQVRIRGDFGFGATQPERAEFIWAQGGRPGTPGPSSFESNLSTQQASTYAEIAWQGWFSFFLETPYVWMEPTNNGSSNGPGDMNAGFKLMLYGDQNLQLTMQLRAYFPTGTSSELGDHHFTLEPALLGHYSLLSFLQLEGELRYWAPIGGTDFAGDILRYGLGISYGQRSASEIWLMPVVEVVGWTVMSGKSAVAEGTGFAIQSAGGETIVNVMAGVRIGFGNQFDIYLGYGRGVTSERWYTDNIRVEFRYLF